MLVALAVTSTAEATRTPNWIRQAFLCIHSHEGAWNANTGNGYYGGLQMSSTFQSYYGSEYVRRYGGAHNWPPEVQIAVAYRAWRDQGFAPWPNTRRMCGL